MPVDDKGQFRLSRAYTCCDIRGIVGVEVQPEDGYRLGRAIGYLLERQAKTVVVGGDIRISTPELKAALIDGFLSAGCHVLDAGIIPTPVFYFAKEKFGVAAGVMVTASHNPPDHNGFKVAIGDVPNSEEELRALWSMVEAGEAGSGKGRLEKIEVVKDYVALVKSFFEPNGRVRVVVDSGNGSCGQIGPRLLRELGYEVTELFSEPDGMFPNRGPDTAKPENLALVGREVVKQRAAVGMAYDGDGDRLAFVDEKGQVISTDHQFLLFIRDVLSREKGVVVYDLKCSDIVPEEVRRFGGTPIMEKTGHTFIKRRFLLEHAVMSGELTGHYAFRELGRDDGMYAALRLARIVQGLDRPLSEVIAEMPRYTITPDIRMKLSDEQIADVLNTIKRQLASEGEISELDGVRVQFPAGWGLARQSITAPELTLRFEGHTPEDLARIMGRFAQTVPLIADRLQSTIAQHP